MKLFCLEEFEKLFHDQFKRIAFSTGHYDNSMGFTPVLSFRCAYNDIKSLPDSEMLLCLGRDSALCINCVKGVRVVSDFNEDIVQFDVLCDNEQSSKISLIALRK